MDIRRFREQVQRLFQKAGRGGKLPGKNTFLILLLTGILLLVAGFPAPEKGGEEDAGASGASGEGRAQTGFEDGAYEAYLEEKTEKTLRQVDGVGEVTVMITLSSGGQKVVEKDQSSSDQTTEEADSSGGTRTVKEMRSDKTSIYTQEDGRSEPYVSKELAPEVEGVVVIADGGGDAVTAQEITEAVQALFGVEAHKIKIMKRA